MSNRVQVRADEFGRGEIIVNGHDLSGAVQRLELIVKGSRLTTVRLDLVPTQVEVDAELLEECCVVQRDPDAG